MQTLNNKLFEKVEKVAEKVKKEFRSKGIVVPVQKDKHTFIFDRYAVKKKPTGFFCVLDYKNEVVVDNINLPQTAALIANNLALGMFLDSSIIDLDANYGYKEFDSQLYKAACQRQRSKDIDKFIFYDTKYKIAEVKKQDYKKRILTLFDKLRLSLIHI